MGEGLTRRNLPARMLRLLSLLQSRREWSGKDLAERLGVTERTIRRDIDRLRSLDYPVISMTGITGGYRLAPGKNLPPLVFSDDEALAVAVGLVNVAGSSITGIEENSVQALVKLEQVLPARLRPQLVAITEGIATVPTALIPGSLSPIDPTMLAILAGCSREQEVVSFDYCDRNGQESARRVEPHTVVAIHGLWYLLAYDSDRQGWRTFRIDRIQDLFRTHRSFVQRELPAPDVISYITRSFAEASYSYTARMTLPLDAETVRASIYGPFPGEISEYGMDQSIVRISANSLELVLQYVTMIAALGTDFTLEAPNDVTEHLYGLGKRLIEKC